MSDMSWTDSQFGSTDMGELAGVLPTGTVTLLLADVEGSTRLWETQPEVMEAAVARLDLTLSEAVAAHGGVRPVEQGEGDSFVIAFSRAADAVACALALQHAPLAPIALRIGVHTGDVQLRDEGNYIGPTINRTARLRDLAHGGQTVLSGATEPLVVDHLPPDVTLVDLGTHPLRDLPRPERVTQLCHPDLRNDFPPLRTAKAPAEERLPVQLTSFIGRRAEIGAIQEALGNHRLVTLTGAGGAGKTRLAVRVAAQVATHYADGVWYVDLAPIADPDLVPVTVARALGLPDQPGQATMDVVAHFIRDRQMLVLLDNCEHLLDATADVITGLLRVCPALTLLTTSREPIGVAGEVSWRVPSLSLTDDALELFGDRARRSKPEFRVTPENSEVVTEICRRLDGLPLAIELAAARVRALSPNEILGSLRDTFRLLTGGARTAVRRQQTLRASVDWSHALLSDRERMLFRRLAVFANGFDLDAAHAVAADADADAERYQVLDQLTLLVDKSLLVAEDTRHGTRYRLLETVRQYAQEQLHEAREGDDVRGRHCAYYTALAARLDAPASAGHERRVDQAETEIDNLRAAFAWSRDVGRADLAVQLAVGLLPLWVTRQRMQEGLDWLDAALEDGATDEESEARVRASVARAALLSFTGLVVDVDAERVLLSARGVGDPALVARALTACGSFANEDVERSAACFAEATELARAIGDSWWLGQTLFLEASFAVLYGELVVANTAATEGHRIAETIGAASLSRQFRYVFGWTTILRGDLSSALTQLRALDEDLTNARDGLFYAHVPACMAMILAYQGDVSRARTVAEVALARSADSFHAHLAAVRSALGYVHLAAGDADAAWKAHDATLEISGMGQLASLLIWSALGPLGCGDLAAARRRADDVVSATAAWCLAAALTSRARVELAQGEVDAADRDARRALDMAMALGGELVVPFALDCLAGVAADTGNDTGAVRLFAAAEAARERMGMVKFKVLEALDQPTIDKIREALGENAFEEAWAEGIGSSTEQSVGYARRGRGERRRAESGWDALTPAELDVVSLVRDGLGNKEIAARLFISPRTVQAHLTHVYTKLGLASRVQLAQEATRRSAQP